MWELFAAVATALLALASTAEWFSWHRRTVGALRARADLVNAAPEGEGRRALREHLDRELEQFVRTVERRQRLRALIAPGGLLAVGLMLSAAAVVTTLVIDEKPRWLTVATWLGVALELGGVAWLRALERGITADSSGVAEPSPEPSAISAVPGAQAGVEDARS